MNEPVVHMPDVEALYEEAEAAGVRDMDLPGAEHRYIKTVASMAFVSWLCVELITLRKKVDEYWKEEGL